MSEVPEEPWVRTSALWIQCWHLLGRADTDVLYYTFTLPDNRAWLEQIQGSLSKDVYSRHVHSTLDKLMDLYNTMDRLTRLCSDMRDLCVPVQLPDVRAQESINALTVALAKAAADLDRAKCPSGL